MTFAGRDLTDMAPAQLQDAETYVVRAILTTREHLQTLYAAAVKIEAEQERRKAELN